ncbi:hypothetical protein [Streptomyces sp. NBC_01092]|nr:hypothetical protein OG254_38105 [Streptomyces sp. NBC_01092]
MSGRPVCACAGSGRNLRPCLEHFAALSAAEQIRVLTRLGVSNPRPARRS